MKRFYTLLMMLLVLLLVSCTTPIDSELPKLDDSKVVELTLTEKMEFMNELNLDNLHTNAYSLKSFAKMNFSFESEDSYEDEFGSEENVDKQTAVIDVDTEIYGKLGADASKTVLYASAPKFSFVTSSYRFSKEVYAQEEFTKESSENMNFDLSDSFVYLMNQVAYMQMNGTYSMKNVENGLTTLDENKNVTDLKIKKSDADIFNQDMFNEIKAALEQVSATGSEEVDLTGIEEQLAEFDKLVTIYQDGDLYTVRLFVNKDIVLSLIDEVIEQIKLALGGEIPAEVESEINAVVDKFKASFKSLNFDYRLEVRNNKITKMSFEISGEFSNFDYTTPEGDRVKMDLKIERFGFIMDFNATAPEFPTNEYLSDFVEDDGTMGF